MKSRVISKLLAVSLISAVTVSTGCFGNFALTRGIYGWNDTVSGNKFVKWLVFLGLNIIPIYPLGGLADLFIFNTLEFWTGSNPMASRDTPQTETVALNDSHTMIMVNYGDQMDVQLLNNGNVENAFTFVTTEGGLTMLDADGKVVAKVRDMDGAVEIVNALGQSVATYSNTQSEQVSAAFDDGGARAAMNAAANLGAPDSGVAAR